MGQKKLIRFKAVGSFANVLQYPENMPGKWKDFFKNENPVTLELACGKGEYTVGLSEMHPERNFIGVDLKGNRIYAGALTCLNKNITNAAFLRIHIAQIDQYFMPGEVDEIWITFPDPQLRTSRAKKRLTHPRYLRLYQNILTPGGVVHLKTDSPELYHFTKMIIELYDLEVLECSEDIYSSPDIAPELHIKTHYEKLDIAESKKVFYIRFNLGNIEIPPPTKQLQELLKQIENQQPFVCQ
jgi:tRNA (guanine-N7-)-methyltransferase